MKTLAFAALSPAGERRVRAARFEERSLLPAAAACVVASGMRETLGTLVGAAVHLRLFEPAIPSPDAWTAILASALVFRYRGSATDAAIVLRPQDARALARAVFGEPVAGDTPLSPIERGVLDRVAGALAPSLAAVAGAHDGSGVERVDAIGGLKTYFELQVERPVEAAIGIALSREPAPESPGLLTLDQLAPVRVMATVTLEAGPMTGAEIAALRPGTLVSLGGRGELRGRLRVGGRTLSTGRCGVSNGRYAFEVEKGKGERDES